MSTSSGPDSSDAQHVLGRFGLMALGLVGAGAVLFMAIGMVSDDGSPPTAAPTAAPTATTDGAGETAGAGTTAAEPTDDDSGEVINPDATASDEPSAGETATTDPDETDPDDDGSDIPNEDISVQVLDGIRDGSDTARDIADDLEDAGHPLVNFGRSSRGYDDTTVFYTDGQQDEAEQVADANGWDVVRPASDVGLSDSVDVHIVVGEDEA